MSFIPLYCLNEHHEAYIAWSITFANTKANSRHLIHIDQHADFGLPALTCSLPNCNAPIEEIFSTTYQQLSVGTFLLPSHAHGFFNKLSWIRPSDPIKNITQGYTVVLKQSSPFIELQPNSIKNASLLYDEADWSLQISSEQDWMLDICLDAFACNDYPKNKHLQLEITESQYSEFTPTNLNAWHAQYGGMIQLWTENKKFYFSIIDPFDEEDEQLELKWSMALERLYQFRNWLNQNSIPPKVITVTRSIITGYTPKNLAERLEKRVIQILNETWENVQAMSLNNQF